MLKTSKIMTISAEILEILENRDLEMEDIQAVLMTTLGSVISQNKVAETLANNLFAGAKLAMSKKNSN